MVVGPFLADAPHLDGILAVSVDGVRRCGAVLISTHLALSIASCFVSSLPLTYKQQLDCVRGECSGVTVPASSVRLLSGPDARVRMVVGRVTRLSVRLTAWWAAPDVCTRSLCGEGWDVALLSVDPSCDHGGLPCLPPLPMTTMPSAIGQQFRAVGFGGNPAFDQRAEWNLQLRCALH